jgi:hypothetical protein
MVLRCHQKKINTVLDRLTMNHKLCDIVHLPENCSGLLTADQYPV